MPNAMRWPSKVILIKLETTYATDPTPTGAANAILMTNVGFSPMEGQVESRDLERPYFGGQPSLDGALMMKLTGSTELAGSGTAGTAPAWGPLARIGGMAQTVNAEVSVVYNPISTSFESGTGYIWIDSTRHVGTGMRGSGKVVIEAQKIPRIEWEFTGLFTVPTEVAQPTPTLSGFKAPLIASKANTPVFTVNGVSLVLRKYELDLANAVDPRLLIGREEIFIGGKDESIKTQVEAVPLTTLDPFTLARAKTLVPVNITHGTVAGNIIAIAAPLCEIEHMGSYRNSQNVLEWPLTANPIPNVGNDQFSITLT